MVFDNPEKDGCHLWITPATSGFSLKHLNHLLSFHGRLVGTRVGQCIINIHNLKNPCQERNFFGSQTIGVTTAVPSFMVVANDRYRQTHALESRHESRSDIHMLTHDDP